MFVDVGMILVVRMNDTNTTKYTKNTKHANIIQYQKLIIRYHWFW